MSLAHKILRSSVWLYIAQWLNKLVGFISTIILARILTPDDFGIVAIVAVTAAVFHVISATGAKKYLLRKKNITDTEFNTAWTVDLCLKCIISITLYLSAEQLSLFFDDTRLASALRVMSLVPFIRAFSNIGMVKFEKEMNYKPEFILSLSTQLLIFTVKITLAVIYKNYWAFLIAELVGAIFATLGSYYFSKYRPALTFRNAKQQWDFSKWVLAKGVFSTIRFKIDNILIAKFFSAPTLGVYVVAKDLATIPAGQIIQPIMQPIYVGLAEHINAPKQFADKVHKIILSIGLIVIPITVGTFAVSTNLVHVFLGDEWLHAIPILNVITYILLSGALNNFFSTVLMVLGKVKASFVLDATFGVVSIGVFIWLISNLNIVEFARLRVLLGYSIVLLTILYIKLVSAVSLTRVFALLLLPTLLSAGMYSAITFFSSQFQPENQLIELVLHIIIGSFVYILGLVAIVFVLKSRVAEFSFIWQTFFLSLFHKMTKQRVQKVGI